MCGIIGYIGKNNNVRRGIEMLKRLEYRGYDSAGGAWFNLKKNEIFWLKSVGRITTLEEKIKKCPLDLRGNPFIFQTRWATHGSVSEPNAHPHWDCQKNIFLVHNGIIENYKSLKEGLIKRGHKFVSQTDTEVLPHLIEEFMSQGKNLEEATRLSLKKAIGAYAIAVISVKEPQKIVFARQSSPLLVGLGKGENFVASDATAIVSHTKKVVYLDDGEMGVITPSDFKIITLDNHKVEKEPHLIAWGIGKIQKQGFPHFMLKEIYEEPEAVRNALRGRIIKKEGLAKLGGLEAVEKDLRKIKRLIIISCGTSYYAGLIGEYMLEEYAGLPVEVEYASEFRYRKPVIDKNTAVLAISQSGETADTISATREAKQKGALTLGIVNVVGSTIARETDAGVYNHAGPEIGVASTKNFVSQLAILFLLTVFLGRQREMSLISGRGILEELEKIPDYLEEILKLSSKIQKLAQKYKKYSNFLYLGRKYNYPIALEGALKLKEISYIHAEGYAGGEMKHGPIALIDKNFPTLGICPTGSVYPVRNVISNGVYGKIVSNLEEIKARDGKIIVIATQGDKTIKNLADDVIYIPKTLEMLTPILAILPLHLFAYYIGVSRGCDVDKPRNLAKSVTVE